jgi:hypothetical protein
MDACGSVRAAIGGGGGRGGDIFLWALGTELTKNDGSDKADQCWLCRAAGRCLWLQSSQGKNYLDVRS